MSAIPPDLINRLRETLAHCNALSSDLALRGLFVDTRLAPWRNRVRENTRPDNADPGRIRELIRELEYTR